MDAVFVHDAAALAAAVDPSLFDWQPGGVLVVADGPAKGRTIRDEGAPRWGGLWRGAAVPGRPGGRRGRRGGCTPAALNGLYIRTHAHSTSAGKKNWVGDNDWLPLPPIQVALGVRSEALVAWVLDRMGR